MIVKKCAVYAYGVLKYHKVLAMNKKAIRILSLEDTLSLIKKRKSLVRLGDGEMLMIKGGKIWFQDENVALSEFLKNLLAGKNLPSNLIVAIPSMVCTMKDYSIRTRLFWYRELIGTHETWLSNVNEGMVYGNAFVSRPYSDLRNKKMYAEIFKIWRDQIFADQDIIMVEGSTSMTGVGNTLFRQTRSVKRIICPPKNAFNSYRKILKTVLGVAKKDNLVLCSLGATAKPLVVELAQKGYWAIDIGHLGQEYAFYYDKIPKLKAKEGYNTNNRTVVNKLYESQVVARVDDNKQSRRC